MSTCALLALYSRSTQTQNKANERNPLNVREQLGCDDVQLDNTMQTFYTEHVYCIPHIAASALGTTAFTIITFQQPNTTTMQQQSHRHHQRQEQAAIARSRN